MEILRRALAVAVVLAAVSSCGLPFSGEEAGVVHLKITATNQTDSTAVVSVDIAGSPAWGTRLPPGELDGMGRSPVPSEVVLRIEGRTQSYERVRRFDLDRDGEKMTFWVTLRPDTMVVE